MLANSITHSLHDFWKHKKHSSQIFSEWFAWNFELTIISIAAVGANGESVESRQLVTAIDEGLTVCEIPKVMDAFILTKSGR